MAALGRPHEHAGTGDAETEAANLMAMRPPPGGRETPGPAAVGKELATAPVRPGEPGVAKPTAKPKVAVDEKGPAPPVRRTDGEEALPPLRQLDPDIDAGRVARTADDDQARAGRTVIIAEDLPVSVHMRISLEHTDMLRMGRIDVDTVLVHPDSRDRHAANDNFGRLILADPAREAAVFHNPVTGEYVVIQGDTGRVGVILKDGQVLGLNSSFGLSHDGVPAPGGHWVLRHHYHPNRPGEVGTRMQRRIPSGSDGDFGVIFREAIDHGLTEHSSRIYFIDDGKVNYTDFGFNSKDPNARYWLDFPNPMTGGRTRHEFASIHDYHQFMNRVGRIEYLGAAGGVPGVARTADFDGGGLDPTRRVGGEHASLADPLTPTNRGDIDAIARRMDSQIDGDPVFATSSKDEPARYEALQRVRTPADVQEAVAQMGLVDRPDAMIRLQAVLSDKDLTRQAREYIARAVLDATREEMRRNGALVGDDDLVMLFHGAPEAQVGSYQRGGIDMNLALPKGGEHDLGPGTYVSRDFQSALLYVEAGGRVLPSIIPRSRLGNVIDIFPGGPLRARWEAFVLNQGPSVRGAKFEYSPEAMKAIQDAIMRRDFGFRPPFEQIKVVDGRGQLVEAFLAHVAGDTTLPDTLRDAARHPDIIFADLAAPPRPGTRAVS
jgi:hypothetical protein